MGEDEGRSKVIDFVLHLYTLARVSGPPNTYIISFSSKLRETLFNHLVLWEENPYFRSFSYYISIFTSTACGTTPYLRSVSKDFDG